MHYLSKNLFELIDKIKNEYYSLPSGGAHDNDKIIYILNSIVLRSLISLSAAGQILEKTDKKAHWRFPYSLIVRTVLMDIIIGAKILQTEKKHPDDLEKLLNRILNEHKISLYRSRKTSSSLYQGDSKFISALEKLKQEISSNGLAEGAQISLYEFIRQLHSQHDDEMGKLIVEMYEHYDLFSKLAHFGEYSIAIMEEQADDPKKGAGDETLRRNLLIIFDNLIDFMKRIHPASQLEISCTPIFDEWIRMDYINSSEAE